MRLALVLSFSVVISFGYQEAAAQASQAAGLSTLPQAVPGATPGDVRILDRVVDRAGAIASIGIVNNTSSEGRLAGTALVCVAKGIQSQTVDGEEGPPWLFASPLWHGVSDSTIRPGINVFNLSIQGYDLRQPHNQEAARHFDYIFTMLRNRTIDISLGLGDTSRAIAFRQRGLDFARALAGAAQLDVASEMARLRSFDDFIGCHVRVRVLLPQGELQSNQIGMNALSVLFWLANYVRPEHERMVQDFASMLPRLPQR
jgi:hypothetical protein